MQAQARAATALLSLLLFVTLLFTQSGCIYVAYLSDKVNQMTAGNEGTLVAAPGTTLSELRRDSTFDIGKDTGNLSKESKHKFFIGSKRFDWQLPDSKLLFKNCSSYAIETDEETGETVTLLQIGTAERYFTWAEVKAQMYDLERRLLADGWHSITQLGETSSEQLRRKLENPKFNEFGNAGDVGGATYSKGNVSFTIIAKLARNENKPNFVEGDNFLHYVIIDYARDNEKQP